MNKNAETGKLFSLADKVNFLPL